MRKPRIENKYNLKPKDIERAIVLDRERLKEEPFWRNDVVKAWCLSWCLSEWVGDEDEEYRTLNSSNEYTICFYDSGEIKLFCTFMGLFTYNFKTFFDPGKMENINDLILQENLLNRLNWLIDERIVRI